MTMTQKLFALSLGFGALIFAAQMGHAAPQCGPRAAVLAQLATKYGETRRSMGIAANNMVMELFASPESQSWTITATSPDGSTCLIASGEGYETVTEQLPAKGNPA
jgi:hypothetical protein